MMVRAARGFVLILLVLYVVLLTWPGIRPFNRVEPLVLGLPFVLFWICVWIVLVGVALAVLDAVETRASRRGPGAG